MKTIWIIFFALWLGGSALADEQLPTSVTLNQLIQSPAEYAFKKVRIEGQVDNCNYWACALCPTDMTNETFDENKCLEMEFDSFGDGELGYRTSALLGEAFRFATIEMEAFFDPNCKVRSVDPHKQFVCIDRVIYLKNAHVLAVHSRKSAIDGLVYWGNYEQLSLANDSEGQAMQAVFFVGKGWLRGGEPRFFVVIETDKSNLTSDILARGLGCVCIEESCEGRWPTRWFSGFNSPANPFVCSKMEKYRHGWQVVNKTAPAQWDTSL